MAFKKYKWIVFTDKDGNIINNKNHMENYMKNRKIIVKDDYSIKQSNVEQVTGMAQNDSKQHRENYRSDREQQQQ